MKKSKSVKSIISIVLNASLILSLGATGVQAAVKTESIPGNVYTFGDKNPYDITGEGVTKSAVSSSNVLSDSDTYPPRLSKGLSFVARERSFRTLIPSLYISPLYIFFDFLFREIVFFFFRRVDLQEVL